ncbi:MAG TPA: response regulator, partial [Gemmatimonadaceae bacterium]|nr:response regulator [Gemmatimonadaceae bacterium]
RLAPDLVLTDLVMPRMGGAELARRLRHERPGLRVLFMSGYAPEARSAEDELPPGAAVLPKPFSPAALVRFLEESGLSTNEGRGAG